MKYITDNLYLTLFSNINIFQSISFLVFNDDVDKYVKGILFKTYFDLRMGKDYKISFKQKEFDNIFQYSMNISKDTETLKSNIKYLKNYYENVQKTKKEIEKSIVYPIFVFITLFMITLILNFILLPEFSSLFQTEIDIIITNYLILIFFILTFFIFFILILGKRNDEIFINIPFIGNIYKNYILYKFTRDIKLLLDSGETIYNTLNYVLRNFKSGYIINKFIKVTKQIESGISLLEVFEGIKDIKEFSMGFALSKNIGDYLEVFSFLENLFQNKFMYKVEKIKKLVEPIFLFVIGIIIISLAYEIYSKIFVDTISNIGI